MIIDFSSSYKIYEENFKKNLSEGNYPDCLDSLRLATEYATEEKLKNKFIKESAEVLSSIGCYKESNELLGKLISRDCEITDNHFHYMLNLTFLNKPLSNIMLGKIAEDTAGSDIENFADNFDDFFESFSVEVNKNIYLLNEKREVEATQLLHEVMYLYSKKESAGLNSTLEKFQDLARLNSYAAQMYIFALLKIGDGKTARSAYNEMIKDFNNNIECKFAYAEILLFEDKKDELLKVVNEINQFDIPEKKVQAQRRIILNILLGLYDVAIKFLENRMLDKPYNYNDNRLLAMTYAISGNRKEAISIMSKMKKMFYDIYPCKAFLDILESEDYEFSIYDVLIEYPQFFEEKFDDIVTLALKDEKKFVDYFNKSDDVKDILYYAARYFPADSRVLNIFNILLENLNKTVERFFKPILYSSFAEDQIKFYILFQLILNYEKGGCEEYVLCLNDILGRVIIGHTLPIPFKAKSLRIFFESLQMTFYQKSKVVVEKLLEIIAEMEKTMLEQKMNLTSEKTLAYIAFSVAGKYTIEESMENCMIYQINVSTFKKYLSKLNLMERFTI